MGGERREPISTQCGTSPIEGVITTPADGKDWAINDLTIGQDWTGQLTAFYFNSWTIYLTGNNMINVSIILVCVWGQIFEIL